MYKIISLLLFAMLFMNVPAQCAEDAAAVPSQNEVEAVSEDDFNFNENSYLTDEQLQEAQEIDDIDDKSGFLQKIINSSHFSSDTATKTYIPINKIQE